MTYDELVKHYSHMHEHSHYGNCPNDSARAMAAAELLLERLQRGDTLLDCSAGRGHLLQIMSRRGIQCAATEADLSLIVRELVDYESRHLRYDELGQLAPRQWDAVASVEVLEHLFTEDEVRAALLTLAGLTRKWLLVSVGLMESSWHGIEGELVKLHYVVRDTKWWLAEIAKVATVVTESVRYGSLMVLAEVTR